MEKRKAIYPGSFDPVTFGHVDLIERARLLFDEIYVVLANNSDKKMMFGLEERLEFMNRVCKNMPEVKVESYDGLTVDYAKKKKVRTIIRGLRATSDFDYEFQMALTNRKLSKAADTVFLLPSESHFYISSRLIKEIASNGGDITEFVPGFVAKKIYQKMGKV